MWQQVSRLRQSEEGAVLPLIGLGAIVLVGAMGFAIDLGRAQLVHSKLLNSADAAGLAVGARMNTVTDLNAEARKFVDLNFPAGYANATVTAVSATADESGDTITIQASATVPTTLMQLLGIDEVDVSVTSEVTRKTSGLELAIVLDNTGSMAGQDLEDLKGAATDLINILYGSEQEIDDLYVGLVPFSQAVNVGSDKTAWLASGSLSSKDYGPTAWGGCVEARTTGNRDVTDDPPSVAPFQPYYWPDDANNDWRTTTTTTTGSGKKKTTVTTTNYRIDNTRGPNLLCPQAITTLTRSKQTILAAIDAMVAVGITHVNYGAVWGWRLVSPRWRGAWGGEMDVYDLPLDYDTPQMSKAVVLMTDGANTFYDGYYTSYSYLSKGRLGTTSTSIAEDRLNSRLARVCDDMKAAGIVVYTVAFGNEITAEINELLQNCASQPDFYFDTPTAAELSLAFQTIGDSLSNLRVSR